MRRQVRALIATGAAAMLVTTACTAGRGPNPAPVPAEPRTIPQPIIEGLAVAPESRRVDLHVPRFSDPISITNPLFPVSAQESVLFLGHVDGKAFRTEVTLLPDTRIIDWQGQRVEVLVSQYVAFLDGRLEEVAYDLYAQDDEGSVWYFGEDVFNFRDGAITNTHGTWIAGKDGPAAMIMPAEPKVGDVYRPENIPGFVFEEVTVTAVGQTLEGPLGPVEGGVRIEELHMDGGTEDKTFGPGYGEFYTAGGGDLEALALAVPTDALGAPVPAELATIESRAMAGFDAAGAGDWRAASAGAGEVAAAWAAFDGAGGVPSTIAERMTEATERLKEAAGARNAARTRQAAIDTARWSLDLQLRYRPPVEVDLARFDLWLAQILVDASAGDAPLVNGDFFALDYIRDRILHILDGADVARVNAELEELQGAVADQDLTAAAAAAERLRATIRGLT